MYCLYDSFAFTFLTVSFQYMGGASNPYFPPNNWVILMSKLMPGWSDETGELISRVEIQHMLIPHV
jgi:hypothetical protein